MKSRMLEKVIPPPVYQHYLHGPSVGSWCVIAKEKEFEAGKAEVKSRMLEKVITPPVVVRMLAWEQYQVHVIPRIHNTPWATLGDNSINSFDFQFVFFSMRVRVCVCVCARTYVRV